METELKQLELNDLMATKDVIKVVQQQMNNKQQGIKKWWQIDTQPVGFQSTGAELLYPLAIVVQIVLLFYQGFGRIQNLIHLTKMCKQMLENVVCYEGKLSEYA